MSEARIADADQSDSSLVWALLAAALFALAFAVLHHEMLRAGPSTAVSVEQRSVDHLASNVILSDQLWVVWATARNAHALATSPGQVFEAEHCFPMPRSLALGEPVLTLGALGMPAYALGTNPIATFNFALFASWMVGGMALYLLVRDWTRVPAAGIVAGLFFLGEPSRVANVVHPYVYDTAWTALGLFFARRFLAAGRWRDTVGLAASGSLQLGAGLYPLLGGLIMTLPLLVALFQRYGIRGVSAAQVVFVVAVLTASAWLIFTPYLELRQVAQVLRRSQQNFIGLNEYLPGGDRFPGWLAFGFGVASLFFGFRLRRGPGIFDARLPLLVGAVLAMLVAAGPGLAPAGLPDIYALLSAWLPGLDAVRVPGLIACGASLALAILTGYGAAALLRTTAARLPTVAGASLALLVFLAVFGPGQLALTRSGPYQARRIEPADADLAFFRALRDAGNDGPILELPVTLDPITTAVEQIFLSAFHQRRTSACRSSYYPPEYGLTRKLARSLPQPRSLAALSREGFTTLLVHNSPGKPWTPLEALRQATTRGDGCLRLVHETDTMAAFALGAPDSCEATPKQSRLRQL